MSPASTQARVVKTRPEANTEEVFRLRRRPGAELQQEEGNQPRHKRPISQSWSPGCLFHAAKGIRMAIRAIESTELSTDPARSDSGRDGGFFFCQRLTNGRWEVQLGAWPWALCGPG